MSKTKRPSLKVIENRFKVLERHCYEWVKETIGNWCKANDATFSYGMGVTFRVYVSDDEVDEDGNLIANTEIYCYRDMNTYYFDIDPDEEVTAVLEKYEEMFGNWYQSDCNKGEWRGA